jgi:hypothetical protein
MVSFHEERPVARALGKAKALFRQFTRDNMLGASGVKYP